MTTRIGGTLAALAMILRAGIAPAAPINLDTGISLGVDPGTTGTATLSATNFDDGISVSNWNAWIVALQLLPNPGASGTMTISGVLQPATNDSLATPDTPQYFPDSELQQPANGTTSYTGISISNTSTDTTVWTPGARKNLAAITFTASPGAQGTWTLYAVNQSSEDFISVTNYLDADGNDFFFGNVPAVAGSSLVLGTITAIPEPTSLTLAFVAGTVGLLALRPRRRRIGRAGRPAAAPPAPEPRLTSTRHRKNPCDPTRCS